MESFRSSSISPKCTSHLGIGLGVLDRDPVYGVSVPLCQVVRSPIFGSPCALRAIGAGRNGNQVSGISELVGVLLPLLRGPPPGTAVVGVAQWHDVVDVQLAEVRHDGAGVGGQSPS